MVREHEHSDEPVTVLPEELEVGVRAEMEYTSDPGEAARVALDHLRADPRYYTKLALAFPGEPA